MTEEPVEVGGCQVNANGLLVGVVVEPKEKAGWAFLVVVVVSLGVPVVAAVVSMPNEKVVGLLVESSDVLRPKVKAGWAVVLSGCWFCGTPKVKACLLSTPNLKLPGAKADDEEDVDGFEKSIAWHSKLSVPEAKEPQATHT